MISRDVLWKQKHFQSNGTFKIIGNRSLPRDHHMLDQIQEHGGSGFTNKRWSAKDGYLQASCGGLDQKPHLAVSTWHTMQAVGAWPDFMHHIDEIHNPLPDYKRIRLLRDDLES